MYRVILPFQVQSIKLLEVNENALMEVDGDTERGDSREVIVDTDITSPTISPCNLSSLKRSAG